MLYGYGCIQNQYLRRDEHGDKRHRTGPHACSSKGVLDENAVIAAVNRMWSARATFQEAVKIPQTRPEEKESKMAQALEEFNEALRDVVSLLNRAANGG
jgi:hypothetical protein